MGGAGGPPSEGERLAFEAWMRGRSWLLTGEWDGSTYRDRTDRPGLFDQNTMITRMLWAAWRDRGALEQDDRWGMSRCDRLQQEQQRFRDPERTILCDILANGTLLPDPQGTRYAVPVAHFDTPELRAIGERLRTQDNRITADPIFLIRGLKRLYGMDPETHDYYIWVDMDNAGEEVEVEAPEDEKNPPENIEKCYYTEHWVTLKMAFTKHGCEEHLRINGHNYKRSYEKVDIFVDSLWRMPEMIAIRNALMVLPPPEAQA